LPPWTSKSRSRGGATEQDLTDLGASNGVLTARGAGFLHPRARIRTRAPIAESDRDGSRVGGCRPRP
jgi:hypothetical protein